MWTDPEYTLQDARERQGNIARELDAFRVHPVVAPMFGDVVITWLIALRVTADYLRAMRLI